MTNFTPSTTHGQRPGKQYGERSNAIVERPVPETGFSQERRGGAITLEEMAIELGVSKSTVSRALSGKGRIGEETRLKIRAYAQEKGIWKETKPEKRSIGTGNLAVVIPADVYTIGYPFFQESLLGISEVAGMLKYHVMLVTGAS